MLKEGTATSQPDKERVNFLFCPSKAVVPRSLCLLLPLAISHPGSDAMPFLL